MTEHGSRPTVYSPGRVLRIRHLHTNEVEWIHELEKREEHKVLYQARICGKARPMLVLWTGADGTIHLLKMTSKSKSRRQKYLVEVQADSFIDCERIYEYNEVVVCGQEDLMNLDAWQRVKARMIAIHPLVAEIMADQPVLLELQHKFRIG